MPSNKTLSFLLVALCAFGLMLTAVAAQSGPTGGQTTVGGSEQGTDSSTSTVDIEGGNVTEVNVTGNSITGRWAGFWGEVSGGIKLTDTGNSNSFYEWSVSDVSGSVVYATNGTVSSWAAVTPGNDSIMPAYVQADVTDNFNNTFTATEAFTSASLNVASTPYTSTWQNGAQTATLKTYSLTEGGSTLIWAAKAVADTNSFQSGETVDYQLLVPADSGGLTYTFYLELP